MKTQFLATSSVIVLLSMLFCGGARADALAGVSDITMSGNTVVSIRYGGTEYVVANGDLMLGTTTRWYIPAATGIATLWVEGGPVPAATVAGASDPKGSDVGSKADDWIFGVSGADGGISSIDGIDFQETIFPLPTRTIFVFERGGNDNGTVQAILADGSLGAPLKLTANGAPYANTNVDVGGQKAFGYVFTTDVPVKGLRISAPGHDALSISAVPIRLDPKQSHDPQPENEATDVPRDEVLSWTPGAGAITHDVYIGTSFEDVDDARRTDPRGVLVSEGRVGSEYVPASLEFGTTYYWRVDEVDAAPGSTPFKGEVWSFTVEPYGYPVANIKATASSAQPGNGPEKTIDRSGLNDDGEHSVELGHMWRSSSTAVLPQWIQYEFDVPRKLHELSVWNHNSQLEPDIGFGARDVTIEYSLDGETWIELEDIPQFAQAPGQPTYVSDITVPFDGALAKYVKLTIEDNWGGMDMVGLSEVRFFYIPVQARGPVPADGAAGVDLDAALSWRPGREAASHTVYFSQDPDAVADGTAPAVTVAQASFDPGDLNYGATYYWRIDEVNEALVPGVHEGPVWSFTTVEYRVVDDFESYNDEENQGTRIYETWIDGITNGSTSVVGNWDPPFAEQTIVHGGRQSMPLDYDNANSPYYAEADLPLASAQDWTVNGLTDLALYVHGRPAGFAELPEGAISMSGAGADIWGTTDEFRYAYKRLNGDGSIVARVARRGPGSNAWAKGGVMIRESTAPDSKHLFMALTGGDGGGIAFQGRQQLGGASTSYHGDVTASPPYWVKLTRAGHTFTAHYSADGVEWKLMTDTSPDGTHTNPLDVTMGPSVLIGLAVTSHAPDELRGFLFDNVATTGNVTGGWTVADIGVAQGQGNDRGDLYVTLTDSANKSATVKNPDAGAVLWLGWTEWKIPLSSFAGVNLTRVKQLTLGIGDRTPDGGGRIYIDDIRLLPAVSPPASALTIAIGPVGSVSATGNDGTLLSIDGIAVSELVLGTTTADFEKYAADHPAAHADDFDLGTYASLDEANVITVKFAVGVTTIFIIERGGNDQGLIQPLNAAGKPAGDPQPFTVANWFKPGLTVNGQAAGAIVITAPEPIFGIALLPAPGAVTGVDPASISAVPAP